MSANIPSPTVSCHAYIFIAACIFQNEVTPLENCSLHADEETPLLFKGEEKGRETRRSDEDGVSVDKGQGGTNKCLKAINYIAKQSMSLPTH